MACAVASISVQKGSGWNMVNLGQWMDMPINERITLITQKKVQFLDVNGDEIPSADAIKAIKEDAEAVQKGIS